MLASNGALTSTNAVPTLDFMSAASAAYRFQLLRQTPSISLGRSDHPCRESLCDSEEQAAEHYQINLIERGWFQLQHGKRKWTLGPGSVFINRPGDLYRYVHLPHLEPDVCLSVGYFANSDREFMKAFRALSLVVPRTNRLAFLQLQLCSGSALENQLSLETLAYEFVSAAQSARADRHHLYQPQQLSWYAEKIHAVRQALDNRFVEQHSLQKLASSVAMSPFLLARIFRELIGVPPHQYLIRVRLKRACAMLEDGSSVTNACYDSGFNDLSHFIHTFWAHFDCSPSTLKASCRGSSKNRTLCA